MVNYLVAAGLAFVVLALWKGRNQTVRERLELDEYKKVRDELAEAKKEVGSLLEQLEEVSEKVVAEITAAVEEVRDSKHAGETADTQGNDVPPAGEIQTSETQASDTSASEVPDIKTHDNKAVLSDGYLDDDDDDEDEIEAPEIDKGTPEVIVELSGKQTEIKTYQRGKPESRPRKNNQPASGGKTILFPRKMEKYQGKPAAVNYTEPGPEVPPKHQMVYAMAKLGYSEEDIAKQLSIGRGEVRLILQLKRKGEEANG